MKLLLFTSVICFAAVLAAPTDKKKRDILPGDPRYGTDHHHHHHHEHENEVQITKAAGGYIGSYTVPDDTEAHSFQVQPNSVYGLPNHKPGKPLGSDILTSSDSIANPALHHVPSTSYGIPETAPVLNNNYLGPVIEEKKPALIKTTVLTHDLNGDQAPSIEAPITFAKHEEHIHLPQTSYGTPVVKTTIHEHPKIETKVHVQKSVIPNVYVRNGFVPKLNVTTFDQPIETQDVQFSSGPSFTSSSFNSYPSYSFNSYPSYSSIPVKTVDHHVQVQIPQPYPVPITKHVRYPVPIPQPVEVPKPYYVRIPQPVHVPVDHPYPVEIPRPVPYPVPHYIRTSVPVLQHTTLDTKANPIQGFLDNTQSVLGNLPSFPNPIEGFQNFFENFSLPSFPSLPSFASQQTGDTHVPSVISSDTSFSTNTDSVTIDNPVLKSETAFTKTVSPVVSRTVVSEPAVSHTVLSQPVVSQPATHHVTKTIQHTSPVLLTSSTKQEEYVQPIDANGGYIY